MARQNTPIWQDKSVFTTAHVYILKNGVWVDTGRHFTALPGESMPNYWLNQVAEDYVKAKNPSFGMLTLYSAYTETQPDAYQVFKTDYTGSSPYNEYGIYNDWSYEKHTDSGHCQNAPVNHHADARQILTYGRWGVSGANITVKEALQPIVSATPNQLFVGAEDTYAQTIVIQSNKVGELIVPAWLNVSQTSITVGTNTIYVYPDENEGWNNRDGNIIVKCEGYETDYDYLPVVYINQAGIVPYFSVYPVEQSYQWNSGTTVFLVHTNVPYTATTNQQWLTYAGSSPASQHNYNAAFNVGTNVGDDREATITFTYQTSPNTTSAETVTVMQAHAPYISLSPTGRTVDAGSQGIRVQISSEAPWQLVSEPSWVTAPTSGVSGVTLIFIDINENTEEYPRDGSVVFSNGARQAAFSVYQNEKIFCYKIYYTSTGGTVVTPNQNAFDENIISNTYTDKGVIVFDDCITTIGYEAFYNCTSLSSITMPDNVTSIGDWAFYNCTSLFSITIPDGVTSIGEWAFVYCANLSSITIPDSVTSIGDDAFGDCTSLSSVTIPDSVTSFGVATFQGCTSLSSVTIGSGVTTIEDAAFEDCTSLSSITIPDGVTSIGDDVFHNCTSLSSVTIGSGVTTIGNAAFDSCTSLSSITIPDSVTTIGHEAFEDCTSLSSITIPDGVTTIGVFTFHGCTSLSSVMIGSGVTTIGDAAFKNCTSLSSVTIGSSVNLIGSGAFENCTSLSSVTIPDSVTSIGSYAFSECTSLSSIVFSGTKRQWASMTKGTGWKQNIPATVVHCTDGDVAI